MNTKDILLQLIANDPENDSDWAIESVKILNSATMHIGNASPGVAFVKDTLATMQVHKMMSEKNKINHSGLDHLIEKLEAVRPEARLLVYAIFAEERSALAHVLVTAKETSLVGCVILKSRNDMKLPSPANY